MGKKTMVALVRNHEAISRAELARLAGISERTLKRVEDGVPTISQNTRAKVVKGFNALMKKQRKYTTEHLFPQAQT